MTQKTKTHWLHFKFGLCMAAMCLTKKFSTLFYLEGMLTHPQTLWCTQLWVQRWKQRKEKKLQCAPWFAHFGGRRAWWSFGMKLGRMTSKSTIHIDLHKPNNKLVSAWLEHFWCMDKPQTNMDSQHSPWPGLEGSHHLPPIVFIMPGHKANTQMSFCPETPKLESQIP
jgi:hypothetical protein